MVGLDLYGVYRKFLPSKRMIHDFVFIINLETEIGYDVYPYDKVVY